jgi:hypothetical protein
VTRLGLVLGALLLIGADNPLPYRIWWSFPNDDETAIEVDDPDLSESTYTSRWQFAVAMQKCDVRKSKRLALHKDGTPVREIRVESLEPDGTTRATTRCVMALKEWRTRIGGPLVLRLEDELDAHASFLMPRHFPGSGPFDAGVVPEAKPLKVDVKPQKPAKADGDARRADGKAPKADASPPNVDDKPAKADPKPATAESKPAP